MVIEIPPPYRDELWSWRRHSGDPDADSIPPHVTLLAPIRTEPAGLASVERRVAEVSRGQAPFEMALSGTGTFQPITPVVFVQVSLGIGTCQLVERALRAGEPGWESPFPYHPHVTVAHDVPADRLDAVYEGLAGFRASFPVTEFAMFEQVEGGVWAKRGEYPLGGAGGTECRASARGCPRG